MTNCALHVQHKDQDVFDRQNRVIPTNVVAVSTDTGDVRFGDGVSTWRDLPSFTSADGDKADSTVEGYNGEGYSGPLHVTVYEPEEFDEASESTEVMGRVPDVNEMVVLGTTGIVFGNGVDSLGELTRVSPQA